MRNVPESNSTNATRRPSGDQRGSRPTRPFGPSRRGLDPLASATHIRSSTSLKAISRPSGDQSGETTFTDAESRRRGRVRFASIVRSSVRRSPRACSSGLTRTKTTRPPSADHAGELSSMVRIGRVSWRASEPSPRASQIVRKPRPNAIVRPSGDQRGSYAPSAGASRRSRLPSGLIVKRRVPVSAPGQPEQLKTSEPSRGSAAARSAAIGEDAERGAATRADRTRTRAASCGRFTIGAASRSRTRS